MPPLLIDLPPHVVEYVLSCLAKDLRSLLRCRLVCPQMNFMIFDAKLDFLWKRLSFTQEQLVVGWRDHDEAEKLQKKKALSFLAFLHNVADYVTHLRFRAAKEVPIANLQSLPSLPALETLDLSGNDWLDTPHLQELAQKCDIVNVNLHFCRQLPNSALAVISNNWTRMESIDLSCCGKLNDDDGHLSQFHDSLNALKTYNIEDIGQTDATILRLLNRDGAAERLKVLRLNCLDLTDASVTSIGTCSDLEFLALKHPFDFTDATLKPLKNLAALKHLHLTHGRHFTSHGLEDFFQNASFQLQHLKLGRVRMNDRAMEHLLLRNQGLKSLKLNGCSHITDSGLQHLRGLSQLRLLSLCGMRGITSAIFNFDADMLPELRFIDMRYASPAPTDVDGIRQKFPRAFVAYEDWTDYELSQCRAQLKDMAGACCVEICEIIL